MSAADKASQAGAAVARSRKTTIEIRKAIGEQRMGMAIPIAQAKIAKGLLISASQELTSSQGEGHRLSTWANTIERRITEARRAIESIQEEMEDIARLQKHLIDNIAAWEAHLRQ